MNDCDELKQMFRERLTGAEMPVREGLWDELQGALAAAPHTAVSHAEAPHAAASSSSAKASRPFGRNVAGFSGRWWRVAASLLLLLGVGSALLWLTQPQEEALKLAVTADEGEAHSVKGVSAQTPEDGMLVANASDKLAATLPTGSREATAPCQATSPRQHAASGAAHLASLSATDSGAESRAEEEEVVHVQVTIRYQERGYMPHYQTAHQTAESHQAASHQKETAAQRHKEKSSTTASSWALKAGIGTSLAKGDAKTPFTASLTAERSLGQRLAVETGVRYHCLPHRGATYHTIEVPLRLQCLLAASEQFELYALAGGSAEKCVAGAPSNSFSAEPVRLAVQGGVGVRYRLSDRLALFAEPTLSHHFSTDSANSSLRTERPTNFNLLCGLRVNY